MSWSSSWTFDGVFYFLGHTGFPASLALKQNLKTRLETSRMIPWKRKEYTTVFFSFFLLKALDHCQRMLNSPCVSG